MVPPETELSRGAPASNELVALTCDGCRAHVPLTAMRGIDPVTGKHVRSAHGGLLHDGCTAKGTWRGLWQLTLLLGATTRDPREEQQ